jgi:hypothetical protein
MTGITRLRGLRVAACVVVVTAGMLGCVTAGAEAASGHKFTSEFTPGGAPESIAVDDQTGTVYVLGTDGNLYRFDSAGTPENFSSTGTNSVAANMCGSSCRQVTVDNSGGPNQGVIYVGGNELGGGVGVFLPSGDQVAGSPIVNSSNSGTSFCGVGVGKDGSLIVSHSAGTESFIDKYQPESWSASPSQVPPVVGTLAPDFLNTCRTAVDADGSVYVVRGGGQFGVSLHKFLGKEFGPPGTAGTSSEFDPLGTAVSVDLIDNEIYSDQGSAVTRFDPSGSALETFGEGKVSESHGLVVDGQTKTVYVANREEGKVLIFKEFSSPSVSEVKAETSPTEVTFSGLVDPGSAGAVIECRFEYKLKTESAYNNTAPCEQALPYEGPTHATAIVTGLTAGVEYQYRLTAGNANVAATSGVHGVEIAPPSIEGSYSSELGETTATLNASIESHGAATTYYFEYGTTSSYGNVVPVPAGELAAGAEGPRTVSAIIDDVEPHVTYHFRVTVTSAMGSATSPDQTFIFFPPLCPNSRVRQQIGADFLPDCRAYELVSPGDAGNVILQVGVTVPTWSYATDPARFAYVGVAGGVKGTEPVNGLGFDTYVASRTPTGWHTTLPALHGDQVGGLYGALGFTANRSLSRFIDYNGRGRDSNLPYVFDLDESFLGRWPANLAAIPNGDQSRGYSQPSPDFSHLAISSRTVSFAPNGLVTAPGSAYDYDTSEGTTTLISKQPNGEHLGAEEEKDLEQLPGVAGKVPNEAITFPGILSENGNGTGFFEKSPAAARPSISNDGSHILMALAGEPYTASGGDLNGELAPPLPKQHLYMRVDDAITYDVSKGDKVSYVGTTEDGREVFFTSNEELTTDDHDTSVDLYVWREATDTLTRLSTGSEGTGDTNACSATWTSQCDVSVMWENGRVMDTSIASRSGNIYFYSPEQLDGPQGVPGGRNIYLYRNGQVRYVATGLVNRMNVSPDGDHMALTSPDRVTSYDNKGFEEMYSYEPSTEHLLCVSCNPTGAPPVGNVEGSLDGGLFMSDDGRTFFFTQDSLTPKDTNKLNDVYEYVEGRPQLITTGTGGHDKTVLPGQAQPRSRSGLAGVTADGVDVYFSTFETLVPEDENGEFPKFYAARTGGGFPVEPPLQPCVAADECHGEPSAPAPATGIVSQAELGPSGNAEATKHRKRRKNRSAAHRHRHSTRGHGHHERGGRNSG